MLRSYFRAGAFSVAVFFYSSVSGHWRSHSAYVGRYTVVVCMKDMMKNASCWLVCHMLSVWCVGFSIDLMLCDCFCMVIVFILLLWTRYIC